VQGTDESWLLKPDGSKVTLPSAVQLYEVVDSEYRESKARVSMDEFQSFMASEPKEYTISALLAFVESKRKAGIK
jgi:hypothetical protein